MEKAQIEILVIDAKQGDEKAFTALCQYFHPALLRFAYKLCSNETLAHDAVQNSWIKITKSLHQLQDPRAFRSWLYQAVRWQTVDLIRKNTKEINMLVDEGIDELVIETNENVNNNEDLSIHLNKLPDIDKQAIHLFYLEEMSLEEIAIVLDKPIGTIKSRLNRARFTLKKLMT